MKKHELLKYFDEELKGLHPCCFQTLWTVDGEYLDMTLIQRSGDLLGASIGINESQYAGLLVMVAWECGLKPRKFTHFIQNLHIYDRHIPYIKELIQREPLPAPKFWLNPDIKDFYEFTRDDVHVEGYETHPQIKDIPIAI